MKQLDNLFGPHIKEFKKKFNDLPSIDISFSNVGDRDGESIYRVSISYLDNYVSDVISSEDEWERVDKMFNRLTEETTTSLRRMAERRIFVQREPVEVRQGHWNGEIREAQTISFNDFCNSIEEVL